MNKYETFEQYLDRKTKEEEAERKHRIEKSRSHHDVVNPKIFESPDGGKTVYERNFGETTRRQIASSPEEKKIRDYLNRDVDMVNHPPHYNKGIETTTYIDSWDMGFSQGNVIKYVTRYNLKHEAKEKQLEDLKKARWYLDDLIKIVENGKS
jgi:hypothetical protein